MAKKTMRLEVNGAGTDGIADEAASVRVGDFVRKPAQFNDGPFRRVRGVYRLECGIQILVAAGPNGEEVLDFDEHGEVEIVTRLRGAGGALLYRVPHPTRSGCVCFVTIPEDD